MLEIKIHPKNAAQVAEAVTTEPTEATTDQTTAIYATMNGHKYRLEAMPGLLYVLSFRDPGTRADYVITFEEYTPEKIQIKEAAKITEGKTRNEKAPRSLAKYRILAAMVHGLITNGETTPAERQEAPAADHTAEAPKTRAEAPTSREETTPAQTTTEPNKTPAKDATTRDTTPAETSQKPAERPQKAAKICYNVVIYTTAQGVKRADIRTESGRPFLDIPAAELDAIRAEIARKDPERATFSIIDEDGKTTPAENTGQHDGEPAAPISRAYIVECRSPRRRSWTEYAKAPTAEAAETIKARAEARRTCDNYGNMLEYRTKPA